MSKRTRLVVSGVLMGVGGYVVAQLIFYGFLTGSGLLLALGFGLLAVVGCWIGWGLWSTREVSAKNLRLHPERRHD